MHDPRVSGLGSLLERAILHCGGAGRKQGGRRGKVCSGTCRQQPSGLIQIPPSTPTPTNCSPIHSPCLYLHDCFILWSQTVPFNASPHSDFYPHVWGLRLLVASSGSQFAFHIPSTFYSYPQPIGSADTEVKSSSGHRLSPLQNS